MEVTFGDNVEVRVAPETAEAGFAGLRGQVYGHTTPSVTGVEVIGTLQDDYAVNVYFEERDESAWFAPELLEFLDHGAGTTLTVDGSSEMWTRDAEGTWHESETGAPRKPWWKFWSRAP